MNGSNEECPVFPQVALEDLKDVQFFEIQTIIISFLNVVFVFTATLGNGMIIVAILRSQNLQTPSYLLITSLAFTDLLVGLVLHPLDIALSTYFFQQGNDERGCILTKSKIFFAYLLGFISVSMATCISIDRYLALTLRHRYTVIVTKKRVRLLITSVWIVGTLLSSLIIAQKLFETVFVVHSSLFMVMLSITCICYIKSFRALHLYTVQVHAQQANPLAGNFDVVRYKKTLKTMLVVLVCLLLCYLPIVCANIMLHITGYRAEIYALFVLSHTILLFNSTINPVIYLVRFTDLRVACKEMLRNLIQ